MPLPPEQAFHEFLQKYGSGMYRGRHDLSSLNPTLRTQLRLIQETFIFALHNATGASWHVKCPPFHVDYIDSDIPNAIAFCYESYSFIGITLPLVFAVSDLCLPLSKSASIALLLGIQHSTEELNTLHGVLVSILIAFVMAHEWAHHVLGHIRSEERTIFFNEVINSNDGNLKGQIEEATADGYSIYHILANFIDQPTPLELLRSLKLNSGQVSIDDETILYLTVVALEANILSRSEASLDAVGVYMLTHPPQAARSNLLMQEVANWCRFNRPMLNQRLVNRYSNLMNAVSEAVIANKADHGWNLQMRFLQSEAGEEYFSAITSGVNAFKRSLGSTELEYGPVPGNALTHPAITLVSAPDEPLPADSEALQLEANSKLRNDSLLRGSLLKGFAPLQAVIDTEAALLPLLVKLAPSLGVGLTTALGAWLHARYGRKVRIKIGEVEVEGHSLHEVEKALAKAMDLQRENQPSKIIKP